MKMKLTYLFLFCTFLCNAQHSFSGHVDTDKWKSEVYLSFIDDYRKISGIHQEQIIARTKPDSTGFFSFKGDQLENENRIYRIHVDNCEFNSENQNHFNGNCNDSNEVIFIAKHTDTIEFPFSFDSEMFCSIQSSNKKSSAFVEIDSIKNEMKFAYSEYRSEASRKLNNKKWFKTLQDFGEQLNEPLAELYIYAYLSDRTQDLHSYYMEDLKTNPYYEDLLNRLTEKYPNSTYTKQYESELKADKFSFKNEKTKSFNWQTVLYILLGLSILTNLWFIISRRKEKSKKLSNLKDQLTKQEEKILDLLLNNMSNKDIATTLFVSVSTVKTHTNNIYKKLNVQSRDEIKTLFNN